MGRYILILVIGATVAYGISNLALNENTTRAVETSSRKYSRAVARNMGASTVNMLVSLLSDSTSYRTSSPQTLDIFGGTATYTVTDTSLGTDSLVKITAISEYFGESHTTVGYVTIDVGFDPPEFLDYVAIAGTYLKVHNDNNFRDYGDPTQNASIHSNSDIEFHTTNVVEGFVTYTGSVC